MPELSPFCEHLTLSLNGEDIVECDMLAFYESNSVLVQDPDGEYHREARCEKHKRVIESIRDN